MSFHLFIGSIFLIYGEAAIPGTSTTNGTIATCTIQGFFLYTSFTTSMLYYCSYSFYSMVGVLNNFTKSKIIWIEKYIHIGVHIYPICSSIYLLTLKAFNNVGLGYCLTGSGPVECMVPNSTVPCTRGPSNTTEYLKMNLFWLIPFIIELIVPTLIMIILYFMVCKYQRRQQRQQRQQSCSQDQPPIHIKSNIIAKQSLIYLIPIYWTIVPFIIQQVLLFTGDGSDPKALFLYVLFSNINFALFGLWSLFMYLFFSIDINRNKNKNTNTNPTGGGGGGGGGDGSVLTHRVSSHIFTSSEIVTAAAAAAAVAVAVAVASTSTAIEPSQQEEGIIPRRYSFNIFDGTNASGEFSCFIHDGDSEDEENDEEQSKHWDAIQDHV
jgi:hypothetical protein